jgi:hypothetical protein
MNATRRLAAIPRRRCAKVGFQSMGITSRANRERRLATLLRQPADLGGTAQGDPQRTFGSFS